MRFSRGLTAAVACLAWASPGLAVPDPATPALSEPPPMTVVDLQPFRTEVQVAVEGTRADTGIATLTNLNPHVGAWFLLVLDWGANRAAEAYHLENPRPERAPSLETDARGALRVTFADRSPACALALGGAAGQPGTLAKARASGLPYAPICDGRLYVRNRTAARASALETVTDFLRDHVWGGEKIVTLVKEELYRDAFLEEGETTVPAGAETTPDGAPAGAILEPGATDLAVTPSHLALEVDAIGPQLRLGGWYGVRGLPDVYVSAMTPEVIARRILYGHEASVNSLGPVESAALVYLVAFDLEKFDVRFSLGTEHPRLGWSSRPPETSRDPSLPGPDGIDSPAPLVMTGMVSPADAPATVATFVGGFKRDHGAFRFGPLAERNHGSHYGFVEQGVVFSALQPGLATVLTTVSGEVEMGTWSQADRSRLGSIRDARQNGVPMIEYNARRGTSTPGPFVNLWAEGNWSGSADEDLRTLRAGLCMQQNGGRRFLIYAYFSAATPSAMARVFQAYGCRYAMHLDMNALEHTYLALYVSRQGQRVVEHLIDGMDVLDRHAGEQLAPRFVGFPADRDFFYVVRRRIP